MVVRHVDKLLELQDLLELVMGKLVVHAAQEIQDQEGLVG